MRASHRGSRFAHSAGLAAAVVLALGTLASSQEPRRQSTLQRALRAGEPGEEIETRREDLAARAAYERMIRVPAGQTRIPRQRYLTALEHMRRMPLNSIRAGGRIAPRSGDRSAGPNLATWSPLGPGNKGGRTRALVIDPVTPTTMYAGGVAGGVFKSTDGGANWTPLSDLISRISIGALAIAPTSTSTVYAGTGEFWAGDGVEGLGIFKSTDGGGSWTALASTQGFEFSYVNDIVVSPSSDTRVYAATWTGVYRSLDAGATWTKVVDRDYCADLEIRTDQGALDTVFAACGAFGPGSVLRNTDASGSGVWSDVFSDGSSAGFGRAKIALAPGTQSTVYVMVADAVTTSLYGIFRSTSSGDAGTWTAQRRFTDATNDLNRTQLSTGLLRSECGYGADSAYHQGFYDIALAVDPTNANIVYTGGIFHLRSDDGGVTFGLIDQNNDVHVDAHVLLFHPTNSNILYSANDGGLHKTLNPRGLRGGVPGQLLDYNACAVFPPAGAVSWSSINQGYETFQFYHGTPYAGGTSYFGGTQDNGTNKGTDAGGRNGWTLLFGNDGGFTGVDSANENNMYGEFQVFGFLRSTNGGLTWTPAQNGFTDLGPFFITPFAVDPTNGQRVWTGGNAIWRTVDGASNWVQASVNLAGGGVSAVAVSPFNSGNTVYVGTSGGDIYRNTAALSAASGTAWTAASPRPQNAWVKSVAVDPTNPNIVYATYSTFGGFKVWKSTNAGASFSPIDGASPSNLPDVPTHTLAIDPANPTHLFAGTDLGVFSSFDGGATWGVENTGFANVYTPWLAVKGQFLFAFTHGRGAWRVPKATVIPAVSINDVTVIEGNAGTTNATFTISLSEAGSQTITVTAQTADGSATAGSDYTAAGPTVLTFAPGETSKTFNVSVLGDTVVEDHETFLVNLSGVVNATIADGTGVGTISSDDVASRTFVSAAGNDAAACAFQTTPCRNIATAIVQTATDGEVIVLTPGEYETAPLAITKGIKITSPSGTVAFIRQPIEINAPGGRVVLRGLTLKGSGAGDAVTLTAADALSIEDTGIDRWATGVKLSNAAPARVSVVNSVFRADTTGLKDVAGGPANAVMIEDARFEGNVAGIEILASSLFVRESSFVGNGASGVSAGPGLAVIQRSEFSLNGTGVSALSGGTVRIGRSRVFGNTVGFSAAGGSTFESFATNVVRGNATNTTGTINTISEQ